MASHSGTTLDQAFGDIKETASFSAIAPKSFSTSDFNEFVGFKSKSVTEVEIKNLIKLFKRELGEDTPSDNLPYLVLTLSQSLKTTSRPFSQNIFEPVAVGSEFPSDIETYFTSGGEPPKPKPKVPKSIFPTKPAIPGETQQTEEQQSQPIAEAEITDSEKIFYPFLAAYLMKLLVKTEYNVRQGIANMLIRFTGFYSKSGPDNLVLAEEWTRVAKTLIVSEPKIAISWVKTFVPYEKATKTDTKDLGLVRFLAILPLSYTGMHAYKLYGEVKLASKQTNKFLIHSLSHPITLPGLKQIVNILNDYEKQIPTSTTPVRDYDPSFKYARLLSPQYFMELQTKNCPALVYVLVELLYKYRKYEETRQNPSSIVGMSSVPDNVRVSLQKAASMIYEAGQTQQAEYTSTFMAEAFTAVKKPAIARVGDKSIFAKPATTS
ncbi:TPA_asm: N [Durio betacytorhabdovirus 1]|nr:TPA_asm: N [Durio betacytorhabdovirus 1]